MSRPARPLREILPVDVDAAMSDRMWRQVAGRRARLERGGHRLSFAGAFALGVAAAVLVLVVRPMSPHEATTAPPSPEALRLRGGAT